MQRKFFVFFLAVMALSACLNQVSAGLYVWEDENGVKHYSDTPPLAHPEEARAGLQILEASKYYETIIFHIKDAPNPVFLGRYLPVRPTDRGYPRYEKELCNGNANDIKVEMAVIGIKGQWMWRIEGSRTKYFSAHVPEGTRPDTITVWRDFSPSGDRIRIQITSESIVTDQEYRKYAYAYQFAEDSPHFKAWMKDAYRVSGHPDSSANGLYQAVQWSALLPKYRSANGYCLKADAFADSWEWHLGKCDEYNFSADPETAGTPPHQARRWYERAGMLYTSFEIEKVEKSR